MQNTFQDNTYCQREVSKRKEDVNRARVQRQQGIFPLIGILVPCEFICLQLRMKKNSYSQVKFNSVEKTTKIILQWPCKKDSPTPIGAKSTISFLVCLTSVGCRLGRNLPILFLSKPRHPLLLDCLMDVFDKELDVVDNHLVVRWNIQQWGRPLIQKYVVSWFLPVKLF